jgi:hypothetical protein
MDSMTEDESDALDDSEFQAEHEKYLEDVENRTQFLDAEESRRQRVLPLNKRTLSLLPPPPFQFLPFKLQGANAFTGRPKQD